TNGYLFLTEDATTNKSVAMASETADPATHRISTFDAYNLYEIEKLNLLKEGSGKQWYADKFVNGSVKNIPFDLDNPAKPDSISIFINAAARSSNASEMPVTVNQTKVAEIDFSSVRTDSEEDIYANEKNIRFNASSSSNTVNILLKYFATNTNSEAWLDFIELNFKQKLTLGNEVLFFRDIASAGKDNVLEFTIESTEPDVKVWDVSNLNEVVELPLQKSGNKFTGKQAAGEIREYVAFHPNGTFSEPELVGEVENQNLHALSTPEFLIVTHPRFIESANALADFHRSYDGMDVEVVQAPQVYNEFSSGTKSATGIRNFIKMFYDREEQLKYVLLFGDGSYDNKNILPGSKNFIPTYQSKNSLNPTASFVTDDYYVLLDDGESVYNGAVDLGIGRIPASEKYQAELVLNKIRNYYNPEALGSWRNLVSFIGDDEDGNLHMSQSETLAEYVNANYKAFITDKIYFDAYMQETTAAVERYPGVTDAINERVKDGVLILNYVGHANTRYLADERVLDVSHINSWSNSNSLPIFVTATCEFSRFDADLESAGEYILFNPSGGGIGLFSTTRLVYSHSNFQLSKSFYQYVFERDEQGNYYRMGDIMRLAKINTRDIGINKRNFSLLADPALTLSYPTYKVVTTSINQQDAANEADTLGALQRVTISGYVADQFDNKLENFSGRLVPTVYDKEIVMETLANDGNRPMSFKVRENIIY
ncbi:MAG TPA: type IX secretion system sortase PorU, partial [Prolixibacteraceae bacterium]|nr:type IX secretion system sortase PorU [Prolixibacteraceae bacterium]